MATSWRVHCALYGLKTSQEVSTATGLLRGIGSLYGDDFNFQVTAVDDHSRLDQMISTIPSLSSKPTDRIIVRIRCSRNEIHEEHVVIGQNELATVLRALLERQMTGSDRVLGTLVDAPPEPADPQSLDAPIKIFVSGDRSQVGKSTVCLGLVGSLLRLGYSSEEIGYIKPATQCEKPQLIAKFCHHYGIECCDIGPIVFYSGFTREFLQGNTESSEELLRKANAKVEEVGRGKKVVVVDGVGYPAVGSICGVSNASVAHAVQAPVVLVGKKGVGDAVDSFNLNACFFESQDVAVLGAIFNRLPQDGYYSLENCRESVTRYFEQHQPDKQVYGFIPELVELAADGDEAMVVDEACCDDGAFKSEHISFDEFKRANQVIELFTQYVNVRQLVDDAQLRQGPQSRSRDANLLKKRPAMAIEATSGTQPARDAVKRSRQEIQAAAKASGAAGG
ncbi:hypothetical protein Poli38472_003218 [Pythium oligandrum]|uniref:Uncharacterized protein n=1 Tax=Pythium oligandrum TaxID=41045 RepID=A0A8K1C6R0_PYTOL|nr:hypothetical protein Poli38472_003218 [Pythium oligandrum]|eukprot:TMW57293.1 hypothetical protein Poli38472_003218 [Pythium oligandrum]